MSKRLPYGLIPVLALILTLALNPLPADAVPSLAAPTLTEKLQQGASTVRVIALLKGYREMAGVVVPGDRKVLTSLQRTTTTLIDAVRPKLTGQDSTITATGTSIPFLGLEVTAKGLEKLLAMDEIEVIQEDSELSLHTAQGIPLMNAAGSYRDSYGGSGVAVAIVDTGIDYRHPALGGDGTSGFPNAKVIGGYDMGSNDPDPLDSGSHGTACAGVAAGLNTGSGDYIGGVAPQAGLYALKVTGPNGTIYESTVASAWDWILAHQYDDPNQPIMIVSTSLGSPVTVGVTDSCDAAKPTLAAMASALRSAGIALFISSGNDGYCSAVANPACLSAAISVGAVYDADMGPMPGAGLAYCVHSGSCIGVPHGGCSYGAYCQDATSAPDQVACYSNSGQLLDLLASSDCAYTTVPNSSYTTCFGGTSAASPYAAGAGAVIQSWAKSHLGRFLTVDELLEAMVNNGDPVGDAKSGLTKPRVNLENTIKAITPADGGGGGGGVGDGGGTGGGGTGGGGVGGGITGGGGSGNEAP